MIGYDLNEQLADREDLDQLKNMGIDLKLDFILNHASAQSPQFRDFVEKKISTVNMLGCHDGIPLLDLKGLLPKEEIERQFQYKGDIKLDYPSTGKIFFNMYEFDL